MNEAPILRKVIVDYTQESDCCSFSAKPNELRVTIEDGGGGEYPVISTARWAVETAGVEDNCSVERLAAGALAAWLGALAASGASTMFRLDDDEAGGGK